MARTMRWPPTINGGRIDMVEGPETSMEAVLLTLSDLQQNPFNPSDASLGDVTFRPKGSAKTRIEFALRRLKRIIVVNSVEESGQGEELMYIINFTDRETRTKQSVQVNG